MTQALLLLGRLPTWLQKPDTQGHVRQVERHAWGKLPIPRKWNLMVPLNKIQKQRSISVLDTPSGVAGVQLHPLLQILWANQGGNLTPNTKCARCINYGAMMSWDRLLVEAHRIELSISLEARPYPAGVRLADGCSSHFSKQFFQDLVARKEPLVGRTWEVQ